MRRHLIAAAVAGVLCVVSQSARAEVIINETTPVLDVGFNACTGELLVFEGDVHLVVSTVFKEDGSFEIRRKFATRGTAFSLISGDEFVWSETEHFSIIDPLGVAFTISSDVHLRLIGLGSSPNLRMVMTLLIDVDEFGIPTIIDVDEVYCSCD